MTPVNVTLEEAYAEACRALGEAIVAQRLMAQRMVTEKVPDKEVG